MATALLSGQLFGKVLTALGELARIPIPRCGKRTVHSATKPSPKTYPQRAARSKKKPPMRWPTHCHGWPTARRRIGNEL